MFQLPCAMAGVGRLPKIKSSYLAFKTKGGSGWRGGGGGVQMSVVSKNFGHLSVVS